MAAADPTLSREVVEFPSQKLFKRSEDMALRDVV